MQPEGIPLSPQQRRLRDLDGCTENSAFRTVARVEYRGRLEPERLQQNLQHLVSHQEILRTRFRQATADETWLQVISESLSPDFVEYDLRDLSASERQAAIDQYWREALAVPLDPRDGPLLKLVRVNLEPECCQLMITAHALCMDRASLEIFIEALFSEQAGSDRPAETAEAPLQYSDLSEWQNEWLESEEARPGRAHWRHQDLAAVPMPALPSETVHSAAAFDLQLLRRTQDAELTRKLRAFADQHAASTADVLLTCWLILLHRLTAQSALMTGLGTDGRRHDELHDVIGPLARCLPLTTTVSGTTPFSEVLVQIREAGQTAGKWQESFDWERGRKGGTNTDPAFFPFCFDHHQGRSFKSNPGTGEIKVLELYSGAEKYHCRLSCEELEYTLTTGFYYDASRYTPDAMDRLADSYGTLLRQALQTPDIAIGDLAVLGESEWERLIVRINSTDADYPHGICVHELIEQQAGRSPDHIAVSYGDQQLSYAELDKRANQLAHHLQAMGVGPDTLVCLCVERSVEMIIAIIAILKAGGAYVPVDPAYPPERVSFLLEDTNAPVLLTQAGVAASLPPTRAQIVDLDDDRISALPTTCPPRRATPSNLVYVIYTSGSTGKPKGVVITHEKLMISNAARMAWFGHTPERFMLLSSFAFDSSVVGIFWTLCGGGTLVLIPEGDQQNLQTLPGIIAESRVSHLLTLPSFYSLLLQQSRPEELASLQTVIVAGEACPLKMVDRHREVLPGVGLYSEYGATETTVFSSVYDCLQQTLPIAPVGNPIDNAQMYILDNRLQPVPVGVAGEVHFGGIALALGYLNRPALTAERFIPHPFSKRPGERLYKSGDLARHLDNGDIEFLGRLDNQVKIRGYRVELEEIEIALTGHPAVEEAVVLARTDLTEDKRLIAYVVTRDAARPSIGELREFLGHTLPDYMIPALTLFLDDMPRTPNGKVDRKALPEPGSERPELADAYVAAGSDTETLLTGIWTDILGLERIGVNDNFFELGGDSILSIQIISRAGQAGLKLTPRQMFEHQTIASLAKVAGAAGHTAISAEQHAVTGTVPLTPVQCWFFELDLPRPQHWNMPMLVELVQPLQISHLENALQVLLDHHDALRLRFRRDTSGWSQENAAPGERVQVNLVDLSAFSESDQAGQMESRANEIQASLNLEQGPLLRAALFERGVQKRQLLLLVIHHLAVDGVSWRILFEDLQRALDQVERAEAIKLPAKTTSFKTWATRLQGHTTAVHSEREYWLALTRNSPEFPLDHPHGQNLEQTARSVTVALDRAQTQQLLSDVHRAYNTQIMDVLLTALVHTITEWTGESSLLLNLEGHGRDGIDDAADLSRTVGWFTTDYPVCLHATRPFEEGAALISVKEQLRAIPNQGAGFGLLRYLARDDAALEPLRNMPRPALGFNYMGQFDQLFREESRFRRCRLHPGTALAPAGRRPFFLEVYGSVTDGCLELEWEYGEDIHDRSTIGKLAEGFISRLQQLITHCLSADAGGVTPSDVDEFDWNAEDLESIVSAIESTRGPATEVKER